MKKKDLLELVIIAFGIYLLILVFSVISSTIDSLTWFDGSGNVKTEIIFLAANLIRLGFYAFGSWLFLKKFNKISTYLIPEDDSNLTFNLTKVDASQVLIQACGIIILYTSISGLVNGILYSGMINNPVLDDNGWMYKLIFLGPPIAEIILGATLLLLPKLTSRILLR
ncbi:MAG: hypothetical protein ACI857_002299 [Arenicella sp.]|jgi:hypothetical protein